MTSFLHSCIRCTAQVRFASPHEVPAEVRCESCVAALKDNEESAQKGARRARVAAKRLADRKAREAAAAKPKPRKVAAPAKKAKAKAKP